MIKTLIQLNTLFIRSDENNNISESLVRLPCCLDMLELVMRDLGEKILKIETTCCQKLKKKFLFCAFCRH